MSQYVFLLLSVGLHLMIAFRSHWTEAHVATLVDARLQTLTDAAVTWNDLAERVNKAHGTTYSAGAAQARFQRWHVTETGGSDYQRKRKRQQSLRNQARDLEAEIGALTDDEQDLAEKKQKVQEAQEEEYDKKKQQLDAREKQLDQYQQQAKKHYDEQLHKYQQDLLHHQKEKKQYDDKVQSVRKLLDEREKQLGQREKQLGQREKQLDIRFQNVRELLGQWQHEIDERETQVDQREKQLEKDKVEQHRQSVCDSLSALPSLFIVALCMMRCSLLLDFFLQADKDAIIRNLRLQLADVCPPRLPSSSSSPGGLSGSLPLGGGPSGTSSSSSSCV